ncbi:MAG: alpha/beta fold hydrolase [Flavobacteriales bacterium]
MNAQPHLLLIHGFPLDHTMWQPNMEALGSVAHVMAPDLLAFGTAEEVPAVLTMEHREGRKPQVAQPLGNAKGSGHL